ncbi:uncharacterized protein LOC142322338 [Lycorma delicatula]|uniref:uncharacterized protein LOC142322338 n=1 Tax=Lycorma delicatula TaxID=130591 RepID=UPI003F50DEFF
MGRLIILLVTAIIMNSIVISTAEHGTCPGVFSCYNCTAIRLCRPKYGHTGFFDYKTFQCDELTHPFCDPFTGSCVSDPPTKQCFDIKEKLCKTSSPKPAYCTNKTEF